MFDRLETSDYTCPLCDGRMMKVTRPVNHTVYQCQLCTSEFGEGYLTGWHDARALYTAQRPVLRITDDDLDALNQI